MSNFIIALGIPLVGKTASKAIDSLVNGAFENFVNKLDNNFDFTEIDGFGKEMNNSLYEYWKENKDMVMELSKEMTFDINVVTSVAFNKEIADKAFCITGSLIKFKNRDELVENIEAQYLAPIVTAVVSVISLVLLFVLFAIVFRIIFSVIDKFLNSDKHKLIRTSNRVLGAVLGFIKSLVPAGLICALLNIVTPLINNEAFYNMVTDSFFCKLIAEILN